MHCTSRLIPLRWIIMVVIFTFLVSACSAPTPTLPPTKDAPAENPTLPPTATPEPTQTAVPTSTFTPLPSETPTPTITPTPLPTAYGGFPSEMFALVQIEEDGDYFLYDQNGNQNKNLTEAIEGEKKYAFLAPDAKYVIFLIEPSKGRHQFWIYQLGGENPTLLVETNGQNPNLFWSPDSERFVFTKNPSNTQQYIEYYLKDLTSAEPIFVHKVYYERWEIAWSPHGKYLGIVCDSGTLCLVDPLTGKITDTDFEAGGDIKFTDDETHLLWDDFGYYYQMNRISDLHIFTWKIGDLSYTEPVLAHWLDVPSYPLWSKDGKKIYFTDIVGGEPYIIESDPDGKNARQVQKFDERIRLLTSSPNGEWIAIRNSILMDLPDGKYRTANAYGIVNVADGTTYWAKIKDMGKSHQFFWTPDSTALILYDKNDTLVINTESGEVSTLNWLAILPKYNRFIKIYPRAN